MNPTLSFSDQIDLQIRTTGPISVATYMGLCLTHPTKGYYRAQNAVGADGDFITAPEISQMFGELIGFFLVNLWQQMDEPKPFTLLELGPGRGTLMADIMRVACRAPGFREAVQLRLFETSPVLIAQQKQRLAAYDAQWIESFDQLGDTPLMVVANEFFDALPIRQFVRKDDGWHERQIGLADGQRVFGLSPTPIPAESMPPAAADAAPDSVFEVHFASGEVMSRLSRAIARQGGAMLAIDYGYAHSQTGETLQGVRNHAFADVLSDPGAVDLSAHVDFAVLGGAARQAGLAAQPLVTQGEFLTRLGIGERASALARANPEAAADVRLAEERLTSAQQMGELFKVFCAHSPGLVPPGFVA